MPQDRSLTQRELPPWLPAGIAVLVIALLVALIGGVDLWPGGDDESSTTTNSTSSTTTTVPPEPVDVAALLAEPLVEDAPASYRVTYEVVQSDVAGTQEVTVRRPYESLDVSRDDTGALTTGDATSRSQLYFYLADQAGWLPLQAERHRAEADTRPLAGLATMIELGLVTEEGTASYAGRDCTVYVTGVPTTQPPKAVEEDETTELCIDAAGLVLYERWQQAGTVLLERTATAVEVDPIIDEASFDPSEMIADVEQYEGQLATAAPASPEELAALLTDITPPEGYAEDGAVSRAGGGASQVVRFYTNGLDLIEVIEYADVPDEDLSLGGARPVEIDGVGEAWFAPGFSASTLRVRIGETGLVEVAGPYPAELVEVIRSMTIR